MSNKYRTLQTYVLWGIDMACIIVSYMFFSWLRFKDNNDWGDKTLHYMVCVLFLLFCTGYTFLADWNRDFIVRGYIIEFLNVVRFVAFMMLASIAVVYFLDWARILSRFVVLNFIWADILLTLIVRVIFKNFFRGYISSDMNSQYF